jgi:hypothetical protein
MGLTLRTLGEKIKQKGSTFLRKRGTLIDLEGVTAVDIPADINDGDDE